MSLVLGIDSGGTKTLAALADASGEVVAVLRCPGLDPSSQPRWRELLRDLVSRLPRQEEISAAVFGLSAFGEIAAYTEEQLRLARELVRVEPIVENDVRIAFDGAFAGASGGGVLVLAGTGSMAWASLNGPGDPHVRVGGWGEAFGDEGSAFWIGRESLRAVSRELDGRSAGSDFSSAFLARLGVAPSELAAWCYGAENRRAEFARLAMITSDLAEAGDPVALRLMAEAADELAETLLTAWRLAAGEAPLTWSFAGGVMRSSLIREKIQDRVGCAPVAGRLPPIGGALFRAAVHAGWNVTPQWVERVDASLRNFPAYADPSSKETRK
ncbi:N-acetylglucosamine kinase [Consotaella salsifontis]|uniref:N-acetylglucosamine kinase n=1 Tax=Consotaella salsifontis TaxID=1365950 RepID=A0A1T4RNV3_9HYPH|nr:BadF/BadG/BcrA/BcrD ATPase family protein [Consotaella salsifontis]SKA17613.1 N-acetylglucosamine kinase [Consotaella salsifontis]